jgi:hypothetical protein
MVKAEG